MILSKCAICKKKNWKRLCPARNEKICPNCCGQQLAKENFCLDSCSYKESSIKFKQQKEDKKYTFDYDTLNETQKNFFTLIIALEKNIGNKVGQDPFYEDQHIDKALERIIQQYKNSSFGEEVLLNRVGVIESIIKQEISAFTLERKNISNESIIQFLIIYQRSIREFLQKDKKNNSYIQHLIQTGKGAQEEKKQTSLIL